MITRIVKLTFGIILVIIGVAGLVLPVLPGVVLIFLGLALTLNKNPRAWFDEITQSFRLKYEKWADKKNDGTKIS